MIKNIKKVLGRHEVASKLHRFINKLSLPCLKHKRNYFLYIVVKNFMKISMNHTIIGS